MSKTAFIFPGQGSQVVGMGKDVAESSDAARRTFEEANDILGFDLAGVCFDGPADALEATDNQQPAILVTSVAIWRALCERVDIVSTMGAAAGLSLGEFTALHVAGSIGFADAVRLVRRRGELMQAAAVAQPSGMVSIMGGDDEQVIALCDEARQGDVLQPANFNCPGQIVISGSKSACERAESLADKFGVRATVLKVAGAFHSPLMAPAGATLGGVLAEVCVSRPQVPVMSNVTAEPHGDESSIKELLKAQVTNPVRWQSCIENLINQGFDRFVEVGPNRALTGMMRRIDRSAKAVSIGTAEALEKEFSSVTA
jgi:[acyl-carrier-protein] S-malonyltransferase